MKDIEIFINSFTLISSVIFTVESMPQLIKIYRKKDAKSISYISAFLGLLGLIGYAFFSLYFNYIEIYPFILIQIVLKITLIILKFYYDYYYVDEFKIYEPRLQLPSISEINVMK